jgi:hypothetical protein
MRKTMQEHKPLFDSYIREIIEAKRSALQSPRKGDRAKKGIKYDRNNTERFNAGGDVKK